jgi:small subunit ribosomal protein S16
MPTKIRLQRHGRKGYAYYHIVIADSRAPRDGKFIERIGSYNPNTNPASIQLDFDKALYWVQTGAQPTDTARNILSSEGVYMKKHLLGGVKKGAFDAAEAERRFEAWKANKVAAIEAIKGELVSASKNELKKRMEAEKAANKAKADAIAKKKADELAATIEAAAEEVVESVEAETPVAEVEAEVEPTVQEESAE